MNTEFEECVYYEDGKCTIHKEKNCNCKDYKPLIEFVREVYKTDKEGKK